MSSTLPELLDPWRAVDTGAEYAGKMPLSRLPRLQNLLLEADGDLEFRLVFARDEEHRGVVHGEADASLRLICQRCMGALDQDVQAQIRLVLVSGLDEARGLPERYDPLLTTEGPIRPVELIEDELLLALPQIPMHEPGACSHQGVVTSAPPGPEPSDEAHPFAALAGLKRSSDA